MDIKNWHSEVESTNRGIEITVITEFRSYSVGLDWEGVREALASYDKYLLDNSNQKDKDGL